MFNTLEFASAGEDEAAIVIVPPFHVAGVAAVLSNTYVGRRIVPVPGVRFSAEEWLVTARDEQVTHAMLVPTMLAKIVEAMEADPSLRVPSLRALSYGGARMPAPVLERALHLFPEVDFVNAYGLTETSSTVAILGPDDHRLALYSDEPLFKARLSSVGQPLPGIEIRIVGESGDTMGPDEPGEIQIRGDQVSGKYVGTDSKTDADGWLHTGDRGWLDVEGYLFCEGRADDTIIRGGENIAPAEIEDALLQHDAISVAAVVGLDDEQYGEKIAAMISLRAGVEEIDIGARARVGAHAHRLAQDPRAGRRDRRGPPDRDGQDPPPPGEGRPRRLTTSSALDRADAGCATTRLATSSSRSGWPFSVPSRNATVTEPTSSNAGSPGCVYGGTWLEFKLTIQRGAVRLSRSHWMECGYGSYSSSISMMWRIGVPVSRTWGLLAFDRSPAIAITDLTRASRQHSRKPTPNAITSPSECPAAAMRSGRPSRRADRPHPAPAPG